MPKECFGMIDNNNWMDMATGELHEAVVELFKVLNASDEIRLEGIQINYESYFLISCLISFDGIEKYRKERRICLSDGLWLIPNEMEEFPDYVHIKGIIGYDTDKYKPPLCLVLKNSCPVV